LNKVSKNVTRAHSRVREKKGLIEDFSQELFGVQPLGGRLKAGLPTSVRNKHREFISSL